MTDTVQDEVAAEINADAALNPPGFYWAHTEESCVPVFHAGAGRIEVIGEEGVRPLREAGFIALGERIDAPNDGASISDADVTRALEVMAKKRCPILGHRHHEGQVAQQAKFEIDRLRTHIKAINWAIRTGESTTDLVRRGDELTSPQPDKKGSE